MEAIHPQIIHGIVEVTVMSKTPLYDLYALQLESRVKQLRRLLRYDLGDAMASMVLRTPSFVKQLRMEDSTRHLDDHLELSEAGVAIVKGLCAKEEIKRLSTVVQEEEIVIRNQVLEVVAIKCGLSELLFLGSDEEPSGIVLQRAMFAVFGAVHVRYGEAEAKRLFRRLFKKPVYHPIVLDGNRLPVPDALEVELTIPSFLQRIREFDWKQMKIVLEWVYLVHWLLFLILILRFDLPLLMGRVVFPQILIAGLFVLLQKTKQPRGVFGSWVLFVFACLSFLTPAWTLTTIKHGFIPVFTELDLKAMNRYPEGKYRLMTDIRLRDIRADEDDLGEGCFIEETIKAFDGNGHAIVNLQVPLFCMIKDVRNLWLREVDFIESEHRGPGIDLSKSGPLGRSNIGIIENVHVFGTIIDVQEVGGLVGVNGGTIRLSSFEGDMIGDSWLGGLAFNNIDTIETSFAAGRIRGSQYLGGLVAQNSGYIRNSFSDMDIEGDRHIGGILGYQSTNHKVNDFERLLVFGSIKGDSVGIIGPIAHPTMEAAYFAGKIVSTTYVPETYAYFGQLQSFVIPSGHGPRYSVTLRIQFFRDTIGLQYAVWDYFHDGNPEVRGNPYWIQKKGV